MSGRAHRPWVLALSITLGSSAVTSGCALVYHFDDYTAAGVGGAGSSGAGGGGGVLDPGGPWAQRFGDTNTDAVGPQGIDIDPAAGAVYLTGRFQNTITIDPISGPLVAQGYGYFLAKLDAGTGKAIWSKLLAETSGNLLHPAVAAFPGGGGVVVTGSFDENAKLAPMPTVPATIGTRDMFLARYTADGMLLWGRVLTSAGNQDVKAVAVDESGMIYITGQFTVTVPLNGLPCIPLLAQGMAGLGEGFIVQFDPSGKCTWAKQWTSSTAGVWGQSLAAASTGVLLGGALAGVTTFDGKDLPAASLQQAFVAALAADGKVGFTYAIPNAQDVHVVSNPATGGSYYGATLPMQGGGDVTVGELDSAGTSVWATPYGGAMEDGLGGITRAPSGDLFITGWSSGDTNFGTVVMKSHGLSDMFLVRLDAKGTPRSGSEFGDSFAQFGRSVRAGAAGSVYIAGDFLNTIDFGLGPLTAAGNGDMAVAKFIFAP